MDAAENDTKLISYFPSLGWTERPVVPADMKGAAILFIGSEKDQLGEPELIIDYRTTMGAERRIVLAFTERGMWIESACPRPAPSRDDGQRQTRAKCHGTR
jgi:hypothetical protein